MDVGDAPPEVTTPAAEPEPSRPRGSQVLRCGRRIGLATPDRGRHSNALAGPSTTARSGSTQLRERSVVVDTGARMYDRDREAAGTLLGSALALRLFLFFVPLVLFALGVAGVVGNLTSVDSISSHAGLTGELADQIDDTLRQGSSAPWIALGTGLLGMITTGRSLSKALLLSSALSWQLGGKQKLKIRIVGMVVGMIVGVALISALMNRIRGATGVAVASASFLVVALIYIAMWSLLFLALPRATTDPGAALPGATLVAATLTGMQAISMMYLPQKIDRASTTYGSIGVAIAILGWFFILGRVIAFSFSVNAVMFERVGSASKLLFALPGVRAVAQEVRLDRSLLRSRPPCAARRGDGGRGGPHRRDRPAGEVTRNARDRSREARHLRQQRAVNSGSDAAGGAYASRCASLRQGMAATDALVHLVSVAASCLADQCRRSPSGAGDRSRRAGIDAIEVGDEVRSQLHPFVGRGAQRASIVESSLAGSDAGQRVEREHLDMGLVGRAGDREQTR